METIKSCWFSDVFHGTSTASMVALLSAQRHHFQSLDLLFILQTLSLDLCDLSAIGSAKLSLRHFACYSKVS